MPTRPSRLFVVTLLTLLIGGCGQPPPIAKQTTPRDVLAWRRLGSWTGYGSSQSESFTGETGSLRVRWETRHETAPGAGRFRLTLHSAISGRELAQAVDYRGVGKDTAYVREDPHVFYAAVESANLDWSFTVDEAVVGTPQ